MRKLPILSVIIPTRNEAANVTECIRSFDASTREGSVEVIVVDNYSTDGTAALSAAAGAAVVSHGPERSAQRNRGAAEAIGRYLLFMDADMTMPQETTDEILGLIGSGKAPQCLYVPEVRVGNGIRVKVRNFERGFYNGTCVDALRVIEKSLFSECGGYDPDLTGPEDWDLDLRILRIASSIGITSGCLLHHEKNLSLGMLLRKKAYYAPGVAKYRDKWKGNERVAKQLGFGYRFGGVFMENGKWKRVLAHPVLFSFMMLERICVGAVYTLSRLRGKFRGRHPNV